MCFLFHATIRDVGDVPASRRRAADLRVVIPLVIAQMLCHLLERRPSDHDRVERGAEHLHVMSVGAREREGQGNAVGVGQRVPLGSQFAAIGGVFSCLVPPFTGDETVALSIDWKRQSIPLRPS